MERRKTRDEADAPMHRGGKGVEADGEGVGAV
jgi:hypothetical protein